MPFYAFHFLNCSLNTSSEVQFKMWNKQQEYNDAVKDAYQLTRVSQYKANIFLVFKA